MAPSKIFDAHYARYLRLLSGLDFDRVAPAAGAKLPGGPGSGSLSLRFFNHPYTVSGNGIKGPGGSTPGYEVCTILSRYLIMAGERAASGDAGTGTEPAWTGFRDLKNSGPLTVYFRDNVEAVLARTLAKNLETARQGLAGLDPLAPDLDARYDLMLEFRGLPRIPLLLLFNDAGDGFAPSCSVLFRSDAETHLDAECIAMTGACLAVLVDRALARENNG